MIAFFHVDLCPEPEPEPERRNQIGKIRSRQRGGGGGGSATRLLNIFDVVRCCVRIPMIALVSLDLARDPAVVAAAVDFLSEESFEPRTL